MSVPHSHNAKLSQAVAICLTLLCLGSNSPQARGEGARQSLQRYSFTQVEMGTKFTITFYAAGQMVANTASEAAFARIGELNSLLSDYDEESELSRLSAGSPHSQPVPISPELTTVLDHALRLSQATDGAFDVTVGPIVRLWRRARRQYKFPSDERLQAAKAATGYKLLVLDVEESTAQLKAPQMQLDLGGIAKGYAADEALRVLKQHGITRALVDAGGDVVAGDPPPNEEGWRIAIAEPRDANEIADGQHERIARYVHIANAAVAQSGDTFQFVELNGVRYSHIVDPRTGLGLTNQLAVTVIAAEGISADSLASALSVLGHEKGLALIEKLDGTEALLLPRPQEGEQEQVFASSGWQEEELQGDEETSVR